MKAQQQVLAAEQELASAKTALEVAQAQAQGATPRPRRRPAKTSSTDERRPAGARRPRSTGSSRPTPTSRGAAGITDRRPRSIQASQQFNAAAVALEMSWLRLFAEAGCLTDDQQEQAQAAVHDYTAALQQSLERCRLLQGRGRRRLRAVDGGGGGEPCRRPTACRSPARWTRRRPPPLQADLQAKGGAAAQEAVAVDRRRAADAQARRLLGRTGRRPVDAGADRRAEGVPDRARRRSRPGRSMLPRSPRSRRRSPRRNPRRPPAPLRPAAHLRPAPAHPCQRHSYKE